MTDQTVTTPAWQTTIRAAQAVEEAKIARLSQEEAEKRAEQQQQHAANLKQALAWMGIEAEPTGNKVVIDGYRFWLRLRNSDVDNGPKFHIGKADRGGDGQCAWFELYVNRVLPDGDDFEWDIRSEAVAVNAQRIDGDWSSHRAALAYALDALDGAYEFELPRYEAWKHRGEQSAAVMTPVVPRVRFFRIINADAEALAEIDRLLGDGYEVAGMSHAADVEWSETAILLVRK